MLTIIIAFITGCLCGLGVWHFTDSYVLSVLTCLALTIGLNVLAGRYFLKKLTGAMSSVEKDLKSERFDMAVEKLKSMYPYSKWQIMLKSTIDSQIGTIYYARKKFDEALPYLEKSSGRNWMALSMLAAYNYKNKNYDKAYKTMEKAISNNRKEPFLYSLYAYFLSEQNQTSKAIEILNKAESKIPLDERISSELQALKNDKKIKMQNYGATWLQLHLGKSPDGVKQYQTFIANQKVRRR